MELMQDTGNNNPLPDITKSSKNVQEPNAPNNQQKPIPN